MVDSRRKLGGREAISGYSLTAEKCTVPEPGQQRYKAACAGLLLGFFFFFFLKRAGVSQSSAHPLRLSPHAHVRESGCHFTRPHHTAALQRMSVSLLRTHGSDKR